MAARLATGPYRAIPGEVLEVTLSAFLGAVASDRVVGRDQVSTIACRIDDKGTISLPVVGELQVAGGSLSEIEAAIRRAYYPAYAKTSPSVYVKIIEYKTQKVSITGAVKKPGVYELRGDQMSLVSLIMASEGITDDGATTIRIDRVESSPLSRASGPKSLDRPVLGGVLGRTPGSLFEDEGPVRLASHTGSTESDLDLGLRMSFRADHGETTRGSLAVSREGRVLVQGSLDLAAGPQRQDLLARLAEKEPGIPLAQVDRQLCDLVSTLESASRSAPAAEGLCSTVAAAQCVGPSAMPAGLAESQLGGPESMAGGHVFAATPKQTTIVLPIKGINIPFADVALQEGDRVVVERLVLPVFSVIGLVQKPGNFPFPPDAQYTLAQAIAFAGGPDLKPDPRYVTVYRLKSDGTITQVAFDLRRMGKSGGPDDPACVPIKPGDIIALEHTPRTRTTEFLKDLIRVNIGAYVPIVR